MKINNLDPKDNIFTKKLYNIPNSPKQLFYLGTLPKENVPSIAIVGTRKPSSYGREVTDKFATSIARSGITIISGLALGVDGLAHKAALDNSAKTIAVLGNGLDTVYPSRHKHMAEKIIASGGAIISEYPSGTPALPHHFLQRNRIVSGLADAVLITEAAARSGTLNTAAHALDQGKDVFVIPGNITSPLSAGCNHLISQGAIPALTPEDIINHLKPKAIETNHTITTPKGDNPEEQAIIDAVFKGARDINDIQKQTGISASELNISLTMLEIKGVIKQIGGGKVAPIN